MTATRTPPRRFAAYLRLTVDRKGNKIGYEVQREDIERYARAMGYEVVWFQDKGITAAKKGVVRPEYERMLKEIAAGRLAGIIVWRLDRLVRLTREFERCFEIVDDANAVIIEAKTGLRTDSDTGRLVIRILVMLAEMEIAAMIERARGHHSLRAKEGDMSTGGCRPFGFLGVEKNEDEEITNRDEAGIKHHRREAALVRDAAERVAFGGATYRDIAREWASLDPPVRGTEGGALSGGRVREILTSARIAGFREYDVLDDDGQPTGEVCKVKAKKWKAIIPEKTWEVLRARAKAEATGPRTTRNEYLFTGGVATCGTCGKPMIGFTLLDKKTKTRVPGYRCNASVTALEEGSCGTPLVRADHLEDTVLEQLFERLKAMPELYDAVNAKPASDEAERRERALREVNECNAKLNAIGERTALREDDPQYLSDAEATGRARGFRKRLAAAQADLKELSVNLGHPTPSDVDQENIREWLDGLTLGERRSWLATQVRTVFVDPVRARSPRFDPSRVRTLFAEAKSAH